MINNKLDTSNSISNLNNLRIYIKKENKWYDFQEFISLGKEFLTEVTSAFQEYAETHAKSSNDGVYGSLKKLLNWMLKNQNQHKNFFSQLKNDHLELAINGHDEWEIVLGYYRSDLNRKNITRRTKDNYISDLRPLIELFQMNGIMPNINKIKGFKYRSRQKPSFAEIDKDSKHSIDKVKALIKKLSINDEDVEQVSDFVRTLLSEGYSLNDINDMPDNVLEILNKRLDQVREKAEKDFKHEYKIFEKGQTLLATSDLDGSEIANSLETSWLKFIPVHRTIAFGEELKLLFPNDDIGKARALQYILYRYNGIIPAVKDNFKETPFVDGQFITSTLLRKRFGWSQSTASKYLYAGPKLLNAIALIILIDTSMNSDCCRRLSRNCLNPSQNSGYKTLSWWKRRSGGVQLDRDFPIKSTGEKVSTVTVIEALVKTTEKLHKNTDLKFKNYCFYTTMRNHTSLDGSKIRLVSMGQWLKWFSQFLNRHDELRGFKYTLDMIRSSKLLQVALKTKDPNKVKEEGQQMQYATAMKYVDKIPEQIRGQIIIRDFMEWFQVLTTLNINDFVQKVGLDVKNYDKTKEDILKNHFGGIHCKDPKAGHNPEIAKNTLCFDIKKCITCKGKQDVILGTVENMLSVIQWSEKLMLMKKKYTTKPKDYWTENWLLWEIFTINLIDNWKTGRYKSIYRQAKEMFISQSNPYLKLKFEDL